MLRNFLILIVGLYANALMSQLKSPYEYYNYNYCENFIYHHDVIDYMNYLAENSPYIKLENYGYSEEHRPLVLLYISTPENLQKLEEIRTKHFSNIENGKLADADVPAIVWFSFGVHGNEAGATNSAIEVSYLYAQPDESRKQDLTNTILILDPCLNPDGYSRYVNWTNQVQGEEIHPGLNDIEHQEPWPYGRVNHYLFDLNRDWAWLTQVESRQRIKVYNQWMPEVHVDFHEMYPNDHYYFAPAAEPYHSVIMDYQRKFQETIGMGNAEAFDREGWLYFTREVFDLLYPSYGDTYPLMNGSIGMTYEKAGHGMSGRAILLDNKDTLFLKDRIEQHTTAALATLHTTAQNSDFLKSQFYRFFDSKQSSDKTIFNGYLIKNGPNLESLAKLMDLQGIKTYAVNASENLSGYSYFNDRNQSFKTEPGDMFIPSGQRKSKLLQALMDINPKLSDSLTYDITAWSLPLAYGLEAYGIAGSLNYGSEWKCQHHENQSIQEDVYAVTFEWGSEESYRVLAELLSQGFQARYAQKSVKYDVDIDRGDILITRWDNRSVEDFAKRLQFILRDVNYKTLKSGWSNEGKDMGGSAFKLIKKPEVLLAVGDGTSNNEVGQVWYYFEKILNYELSRMDFKKIDGTVLANFNTLILAEGSYDLSNGKMDEIEKWISNGGKLIVIGSAIRPFANAEKIFGIRKKEFPSGKDSVSVKELEKNRFEDAERNSIASSMPGAIIGNVVDNSNPMSLGLGDYYFSLKTDKDSYKFLNEGWNAIYTNENLNVKGFIGSKLLPTFKNSLTYGFQNKGNGSVIYMVDNPLYRGFWKQGELIFSNSLFFVQ